jgi:serine/threonine-protein kinase
LQRLGDYELLEQLGRGGMGEVYRARQLHLNQIVALKVLPERYLAEPQAVARFRREMQSIGGLSHPNIVRAYNAGEAAGRHFLVMEYVEGVDLQRLVDDQGRPLAAGIACELVRQVAHGLHHALEHGLVHRDIKPANVFAAKRGGICDVAKVLDFGLVREQASQTVDVKLTQPGTFVGSPLYMCPEQLKSSGKLDARSDIYSLGAVAYYLVTGRPPFVGDDIWEIIAAHSRDVPEPTAQVHPGVPTDLENIIFRCLAKQPVHRFQDADSLDKALAACACAGQWTEEQAAAWWKGIEQASAQHSTGR